MTNEEQQQQQRVSSSSASGGPALNNNGVKDEEVMPPPTQPVLRASSSMAFVCPSGVPFPWKLHEILEYAEANDLTHIVSYVPAGNGFKVHNPPVFADSVMPLFFGSIKIKSFQRQLNMWGFERVCNGPDRGAYTHTFFIKGNPDLCHNMKRIKVKGTGHSLRASSSASSHGAGGSSVYTARSSNATSHSTGSRNSHGSNTTTSSTTFTGGHHHNHPEQYHQLYGPAADPVTAAATAWTSTGHVMPAALPSYPSTTMSGDVRSSGSSNSNDGELASELEAMKNRLDAALHTATPAWNNQQPQQQQQQQGGGVPFPTGMNLSSSGKSVLNEGDCILFEGRNFFFVGDEGRRRQWMEGRRQSKEAKGNTQPPPPSTTGLSSSASAPSSDSQMQQSSASTSNNNYGYGGYDKGGNSADQIEPIQVTTTTTVPLSSSPKGGGGGGRRNRRVSKRFSLEPMSPDGNNFVLKELMDMTFDLEDDVEVVPATYGGTIGNGVKSDPAGSSTTSPSSGMTTSVNVVTVDPSQQMIEPTPMNVSSSLTSNFDMTGLSGSLLSSSGNYRASSRRLSKRYSLEPNPIFDSAAAKRGTAPGGEQIPSYLLKELLDLDLEFNGDEDEDNNNNKQDGIKNGVTSTDSGGSSQQKQGEPNTRPQYTGDVDRQSQGGLLEEPSPEQPVQDQVMIDLPATKDGKRFSLLATALSSGADLLASLGSIDLGDDYM